MGTVTDAERDFFTRKGWRYEPETGTKHELFFDPVGERRAIVRRPDGWCSRFNGGRFADPITAYVNAEVEQWGA